MRHSESKRKQPFVLCVGDLSKLMIVDVYVMVERKLQKATSITSAVDLCFKLFHVLKLAFPEECYPTWCFFDHCVFQINKIASPPASVLTLGSQIEI
jgi:hypothetical protein